MQKKALKTKSIKSNNKKSKDVGRQRFSDDETNNHHL